MVYFNYKEAKIYMSFLLEKYKLIMKKIFILIVMTSLCIMGCENVEPEYPDFDLKAVYFPFQTPIRTLSFGEDRFDNSLDKQLIFDIGVTIGGMYKNKKNWTVDYVVDNELLSDQVLGNGGLELKLLPETYYSLNPTKTIIIPKGLFNGRIRVQLSEEFIDDPLAITGQYVIPIRLTNTSADSILSGKPVVASPDRRIDDNWEALKEPKDWVLFGIKYVNAYEGTWLQKGKVIKYAGDQPVDTIVYHQVNPERDKVVAMKTINKNKVATNFIANIVSSSGDYSMELEFSNMWGTPGGAITITPNDNAVYEVNGNGQYFDKATSNESWIGLVWPSMHLNYTYSDGTYTYQVKDTLTFRDRGLKIEEHALTIIK